MDQSMGKQGGWVGLIVMLLALAIVAWLSRDALKAYGLLPSPATTVTTKAGTPGERARAAGAVGAEAVDMSSAPVAPATAIDRARGMEDMVKQQAAERASQGDGSTR